MKKLLFTTLAIFVFAATFAQLDDLKKDNNKNGSNKNLSDSGTSSLLSDPCTQTCATMAFDFAINVGTQILWKYNQHVLATIKDPHVISLEILPHAGMGLHLSNDQANLYKYYQVLPRIRGNYGAFSSEFKLDLQIEANDSVTSTYTVYDWWFGMNIIPNKDLRFTLGQGVAVHAGQNKIYSETFLGSDIYFKDYQYGISPEMRVDYDIAGKKLAFLEAGVRGKVRVMDFKHFSTYVVVGGAFKSFAPRSTNGQDIAVGYGGLTFNIH